MTTPPRDQEIAAMEAVEAALRDLDRQAQNRVLTWAKARVFGDPLNESVATAALSKFMDGLTRAAQQFNDMSGEDVLRVMVKVVEANRSEGGAA